MIELDDDFQLQVGGRGHVIDPRFADVGARAVDVLAFLEQNGVGALVTDMHGIAVQRFLTDDAAADLQGGAGRYDRVFGGRFDGDDRAVGAVMGFIFMASRNRKKQRDQKRRGGEGGNAEVLHA